MLSSAPLTFNAFGPLKLDLKLATRVAARIRPVRQATYGGGVRTHGKPIPPVKMCHSFCGELFDHASLRISANSFLPSPPRNHSKIDAKSFQDCSSPQRAELSFAQFHTTEMCFWDVVIVEPRVLALRRPPFFCRARQEASKQGASRVRSRFAPELHVHRLEEGFESSQAFCCLACRPSSSSRPR